MKTTIRPPVLVVALLGLAALSSQLVAGADPKAKTPVKPYPLTLCIVTDNDLGSMGDERSFVYEGQEIKICCKPCERTFLKSPGKYLQKLAKQSAESGEKPAN
jgi:hypothetical protein